ncbi:Chromo domain containing protein [Pyrenophora tritici-repentis]|nr:Chromo domain containing protein [Pyrenophora tritici-repentis]
MIMYQDSETDDFSDEYLFALGDTAEVDDTSAAPLTEPDTSLDEANILQTRRILYHLIHGLNRIRLELSDCLIHDRVFYVKKKVYIPESGTLRTRIIERVHRSYCGGYSGKHAQYVKNCLACWRSKSYRDGKHGLLHPLPIPKRYWSSISIDYITHLPPCTDNGRTYTNVLVIVNRLSKKKKFIPVVDLKVDTLVKAFVEYVWREEGYPDSIVSDRGAQFLSHFWTRLCQRLGTKPKLSTGYHPETDGQTENANAWLKQYLRSYINYEQDNWALFLPIAEFEANNAINASTKTTAFRLTKGYDPKSGLEPPKSQAKQAEYANDAQLLAPKFKVGDQVMLDARNFRTTRPSLSLDFKNRGPFTVTRVINNIAYELLLPLEIGKLHNVFHPWLLHLHEEAPLPSQLRDSAPAEFADPDEEDGTSYEVEAVLDSRVNKRLKDPYSRSGLLQYLVRWANYPDGPDNPSWEPYMNLADSADIV